MDRPTDWENSLVMAKKKDGNLRLCLDTQDLNKVIKCEQYRIPTAEDTASKLAGKSVFFILGEKDGFWHPSFWGKRVPFVTSMPLSDDNFF